MSARGGQPGLSVGDAVLAGAAGVVLGLVLLNALGALAARQDTILILAGLMATALVGHRLVSPPGPDVPLGPDLLHPATGAYLALAGALLMVGGGLASAMGRAAPAPAPAPEPAPEPPTPVQAQQFKIWDAS